MQRTSVSPRRLLDFDAFVSNCTFLTRNCKYSAYFVTGTGTAFFSFFIKINLPAPYQIPTDFLTEKSGGAKAQQLAKTLPELCQQFSIVTAVGGVSLVDQVRITAQPKNAQSPLGGHTIWLQQPGWAAFGQNFLAWANLGVPRGGIGNVQAAVCRSLNADARRGVKRCIWVAIARAVSMFRRYFLY